jgi:hypothetical protein
MTTRHDGSSVNDGINNNTYELLFKDYPELPKEEHGSREDALRFLTLDRFTRYEKRNLLVKFKDFLKKQINIDISKISYDEENDRYIYNDEDFSIPFNLISRICEGPGCKEELLSEKRYGKCHSSIISIAPSVPNSYVVTGYVTIGSHKVLHTILEIEQKDNNVILDWTRNLEMRKEDYYRLTKFEEVSRFEGKHPKEDLNYITGLHMGCKTYVTFRDEIMRDIEKNKSLFKKKNES